MGEDVEVAYETSGVETAEQVMHADSQPPVDGPASEAAIPAAHTAVPEGEEPAHAGEAADLKVLLEGVVERLDVLADQFKSRIARSEYEEQMLKRYSDEIAEYRADLYKKITLPLIKELIGVRDAACQIVDRAVQSGGAEPTVGVDSVAFLRDMLETALDNHGVTVRQSEIGSLPERGVDRPIGRVQTSDESAHGTIAAAMNDAYFFEGSCIAPSKVKVFVYEPTNVDSPERSGRPEAQPTDAPSSTTQHESTTVAVSPGMFPAPMPEPAYIPDEIKE